MIPALSHLGEKVIKFQIKGNVINSFLTLLAAHGTQKSVSKSSVILSTLVGVGGLKALPFGKRESSRQ